eukprot:jgi/Ulvmu1/1556/UM110_0019.1
MLANYVCRAAFVGRDLLFRASLRDGPLRVDGHGVRTAFTWTIPALTQLLKKKGERRIGDVHWFDEYSDLGDDPNATHAAMVEEDQRLRASDVFKSPLRKQVFHEILKYRRAFQQADEPAVFGDCKLLASETPAGAPCWMKESADGTRTIIASAEPDDFGEAFHQIADLRLSPQQDKVAILVNDGRHPDAFTALIKPVGTTACFSGVMEAQSASDTHSAAHSDALEAVGTLQWLADGQHVVYSRVGALATPTEAWLHRVGTPEALDRLLYEEEEEAFSVHVSATRDARYVTITAMSKTATEVHTMDAADPAAAPTLVHRRTQGLLYWVCHAHGHLVIMHSGAPPQDAPDDAETAIPAADAVAAASPEYRISVTLPPAPPAPGEPPSARSTWRPLVTRRNAPADLLSWVGGGGASGSSRGGGTAGNAAGPVIALEDMVLFKDHLVLCCRRDGVPALLTAPWSFFGIGDTGPRAKGRSGNASGEGNGGGESAGGAAAATAAAVTPQAVEDLPELPLPEWALQVAPGANLQFDGDTYVCHAASPAHPEQELRFHLPTLRLLPVPPLAPELLEAVEGINTKRIHVPVAAEPQEADYLEMVFSLLPRVEAASGGGGAAGAAQEEGAEADDHSAAEARIAQRAGASGAQMPVTLAWQGDLGGGPRPAVLRAYGAYGLCADVGFHPDDLPLLHRGVVIITAHVRGGGELGRTWHLAAVVHRKWSTMYDYAAALRCLFDRRVTAPGLVAAEGFSAGALLAAHVLNKVPAALAAALLRRPFVTLLNTMTDPSLPLTAHEYAEWGDPAHSDVPSMWARMSPHKSITASEFPAVLVSAGLRDTRVEWWGPVKYAWRLRAHQQDSAEVLLLWDGGGHFYDDPNSIALEKTFLLLSLLQRGGMADRPFWTDDGLL